MICDLAGAFRWDKNLSSVAISKRFGMSPFQRTLLTSPQLICGWVSTGNLMAELSQKTVCFSDKSPDWIHRKSFGDFPKSS
jgi:hypothetical protein